jgi:hypothetical protein
MLEYAVPTGVDFVLGLWFYKGAAPTALLKPKPGTITVTLVASI